MARLGLKDPKYLTEPDFDVRRAAFWATLDRRLWGQGPNAIPIEIAAELVNRTITKCLQSKSFTHKRTGLRALAAFQAGNIREAELEARHAEEAMKAAASERAMGESADELPVTQAVVLLNQVLSLQRHKPDDENGDPGG